MPPPPPLLLLLLPANSPSSTEPWGTLPAHGGVVPDSYESATWAGVTQATGSFVDVVLMLLSQAFNMKSCFFVPGSVTGAVSDGLMASIFRPPRQSRILTDRAGCFSPSSDSPWGALCWPQVAGKTEVHQAEAVATEQASRTTSRAAAPLWSLRKPSCLQGHLNAALQALVQ